MRGIRNAFTAMGEFTVQPSYRSIVKSYRRAAFNPPSIFYRGDGNHGRFRNVNPLEERELRI